MIVKKQICKVKTDSIAVYVYNDTTKHSQLKSTVSLEVSINSTVQQVVNVPKDESMLSLKPKLETSVLTSKESTTKNTSYDTIQAKSNSLEVKEEVSLTHNCHYLSNILRIVHAHISFIFCFVFIDGLSFLKSKP